MIPPSETIPLKIILDDPELHPILAAAYSIMEDWSKPAILRRATQAWLHFHPTATWEVAMNEAVRVLDAEELEHRFLCGYAQQMDWHAHSLINSVDALRIAAKEEKDLRTVWAWIEHMIRSGAAIMRMFEVGRQGLPDNALDKARVRELRKHRMELLRRLFSTELPWLAQIKPLRHVCEHWEEYVEREIFGPNFERVYDLVCDDQANVEALDFRVLRAFYKDTEWVVILDRSFHIPELLEAARSLIVYLRHIVLYRFRYARDGREITWGADRRLSTLKMLAT